MVWALVTLSTTNPTSTALGLNPSLSGKTWTNNLVSHDKVPIDTLLCPEGKVLNALPSTKLHGIALQQILQSVRHFISDKNHDSTKIIQKSRLPAADGSQIAEFAKWICWIRDSTGRGIYRAKRWRVMNCTVSNYLQTCTSEFCYTLTGKHTRTPSYRDYHDIFSWEVPPYSLVEIYQIFRGEKTFHHVRGHL